MAVTTVLGVVSPEKLRIVDAHNHVWIEAVPGAIDPGPSLSDYRASLVELQGFREAGGDAILDCQPAGCGRNTNTLAGLAEASRVHIIACTGFHRRRYYPDDSWLWRLDALEAGRFFLSELNSGLVETLERPSGPVRAGFVKVACEASLASTPAALLEGAAWAASLVNARIIVHTEQGASAAQIVESLLDRNVRAGQLVLCHMDKRPDFGLHSELAQMGILLEYDTFYRAKYEPETHLWPLIVHMAEAGLEGSVALATDMADAALWVLRGGPGFAALPSSIRSHLLDLGIPKPSVDKMLGHNIVARLAGLSRTPNVQEI